MNINMSGQENFVRHTIVDQQQQGIVLGTFDHPANWQAESNVYWNYQNTCLPAVCYARTVSSENSAAFEFLPMECFSWTEPEMGIYSRGQNTGGAVNLPPMPGVDALVHLIIPKYRGNRQGLRIAAANAEPAPVKPPAQIPPQNVVGHKVSVKIEYSENGQIIEEEFRCLHTIIKFPPVSNGWGTMYFTTWSLTELCCFRAERGNFDDMRETSLKIQASLQINPQWVDLSNKISQMLLQNSQQIANESTQAGWEMLRMNGERIRETQIRNQNYINAQEQRIKESYNTPPPSRQSDSIYSNNSEYSSHDAMVDMIREEESIYNPENSANEKVSGYHDHIWKDELGNVQATNDPNYDPNAGSNRNWTQARKKRIGD